MKKDTRNWISLAEYDIESASHMLNTGRYLYVVFLCHLALEKMLKAHVVEKTNEYPPKTHDLILLLRKSGLKLPQELLEFIGKLNTASVLTRYPEDLQNALQQYPQPIAETYLDQTRAVLQWLINRL